ncbi:tetraacyldisaccharide 4'-kinase [Marinobacter sp. F3R08]|uniref:tetraacyldisaccharide 4'-kinase n=1 Tax=Marinobacter sp. F3R08 TaxID=2841559 RepID=UPI001C091FB6|nr:tetraacyldisaccharide 4'-kinase [Marinobacter sp. F3R08]MBU2955495.1 tetraacyldisaccharide 4'-kinase [Marinobacter sp. F3R08]
MSAVQSAMSSLVERLWYGSKRPLAFLAPLAWLYRSISETRRRAAWEGRNASLPVPVIVVGNITAGGTGKSPLTAWLVSELASAGWRPVILSRGYGGDADQYPLEVTADTSASKAGDEPVMLALNTGYPVVVDPQRRRGADYALENNLGDLLICDDGLQHYKLPRDLEISVFDGQRGIGNGAMIPVGPLREPVSRLASVDFIIVNGKELSESTVERFADVDHPAIYSMVLEPAALIHLKSGKSGAVGDLNGKAVKAVAGIGNPARFFGTLRALGAEVNETVFPDHHRFCPEDLIADNDEMIVMTAKDAVKCRDFAPENAWILVVEARLPDQFRDVFLDRVRQCSDALIS